MMNSNRGWVWGIGLVVWLWLGSSGLWAAPLGSAFTYQGHLVDRGRAADGSYSFRFGLYDAATEGTQIGSTVQIDDVTVLNGLFTVELDFGGSAFTGDARWLEISVQRTGSIGKHTTLSPRQNLTPTSYALYVPEAGNADTVDSLHANDLVITSVNDLSGGTITSSVTVTGNVVASGVVQAGLSPSVGFGIQAGDVVAADDLLAGNNIGLGGGGQDSAIFIRHADNSSDAIALRGSNRTIKINPPKTRWLSLGYTPVPKVDEVDGSFYQPWRHDGSWLMAAENHTAQGYFPVHLPDGAIVTGLYSWGSTEETEHFFSCSLRRHRIQTSEIEWMAECYTVNTNMTLSDTSVEHSVIDNEDYYYYVYARETTAVKDHPVYFYGARISYTIDTWP